MRNFGAMPDYTRDYSRNTISEMATAREAMARLDTLGHAPMLFATDGGLRIVGTVTDGDIRRGLLQDISINSPVGLFMDRDFAHLVHLRTDLSDLDKIRRTGARLVPVLDAHHRLVKVVDFEEKRSLLPVEAVIMAGGRGERLRPYTDKVPKPLLKVGGKPILEHTIDRLILYGVERIYLSVRYLGEQVRTYFGDGSAKGISIEYLTEQEALGTIGGLRHPLGRYASEAILVMNADLLTNIDFEAFYRSFSESNADYAMATTPYEVQIPYAVVETEGIGITSFREKPTYTYYANAGIYLFKREYVGWIPENTFFNATDLIESLIRTGKKGTHFPIRGYWLDIGRHEEYQKAQEDIKYIRF